ncbi:hypothetical protein Tco_0443515 [Tanacetum coccineum]
MGDGHINTTPKRRRLGLAVLVRTSMDSITEKSRSRTCLSLLRFRGNVVEVCVDDDDTDDDDDYDDDVYVDDCVDIEEDGGEIDLDISKIVDISLRVSP